MRRSHLGSSLLVAMAGLVGCGSGGSGGSKGPAMSITGVEFVVASGMVGLPAPALIFDAVLTGDPASLNGQTVYIGLDLPELGYSLDHAFYTPSTQLLEMTFLATTVEPVARQYQGSAKLSLCLDPNCHSQLGNSPVDVPYSIEIGPGLTFSTPEVVIDVPFGTPPEAQTVEVLLPPALDWWRFTAGIGNWISVTQDGQASRSLTVAPRAAPAGEYSVVAMAEARVPDISRPPGTFAMVTAVLPVTLRIRPDPSRPAVLLPDVASFQFTIDDGVYHTTLAASAKVWEQVPGGTLQVVGTSVVREPPVAASSPLSGGWLTPYSSGGSPYFLLTVCRSDYSGPSACLPPGPYEGVVHHTYTGPDGTVTALDLRVEMTIDPGCGSSSPDILSDPQNCGGCFRRCGPGFSCNAGACECDTGRTVCGLGCYDLANDSMHCGTCDVYCRGTLACADGRCCPAGLSDCFGTCVDLKSDRTHCGRCANACADVYACFDGTCGCAPGQLFCGQACREVASDRANCGACGVTCNPEQACVAGACRCPAGESACAGAAGYCAALQADPSNCGTCGNRCAAGEACAAGTCGCAPGSARCGGATCVDLATDAYHCGTCDAQCPQDQTCQAGACVADLDASRMAGVDPARSGVNAGERGVPPLTLAWQVETLYSGGPAVVEGGRVVAGAFRSLLALEASSGAELWRRDMSEAVVASSPTVSRGKVYLQWVDRSEVGHLDQMDLGTGSVEAGATFASQWQRYLSPLVVGDGVFIGAGVNSGLRGYGLTPPFTERFSLPATCEDGWAAGWAAGAVHSVLDATLRAQDPLTGAVTASRELAPVTSSSLPCGTPVFGDSLGYVLVTIPGAGPSLHAFTPGTLAPAWALTDSWLGRPAVWGGELYVLRSTGPGQSRLEALDAATGALRWSFDGDGALRFAPVIAAGHLYVASGAAAFAVDLSTHQQVWTAPTGGELTVGTGMLFVNDTAHGVLYAYRLSR